MRCRSPLPKVWAMALRRQTVSAYAFFAAGAGATAIYLLLPTGELASAVYSLIGASAAAALAVAGRRIGGVAGQAWSLFACGVGLLVAGDTVFMALDRLGWATTAPSAADWLYLAAYPTLAVGCLILLRTSGIGRRGDVVVDSLIVALGTAAILWEPYFSRVSRETRASLLGRLTLTAYPTWDLLLLGLLSAVVVTRSFGRRSTQLLVCALLLLLSADFAWAVAPDSYFVGSWMDGAYLLAYITWATAGLHPSAARVDRPRGTAAWQRLAVLSGAMLAAPIDFTVDAITGRSFTVIDGVIAIALVAAVLVRLSSSLHSLATMRRELAMRNAQLRESEGRFRAVIESGADVTVILDRGGTIVYTSPSVERMLGWGADELVGQKPSELWDPAECPALLERVAAAAHSPGPTEYGAHKVRTKTGSWRLIETTSVNLLADPLVRGYVNTLRDVTDRRALEERLRASERLEAIGQLAGGVAHDFNNVLLVIRGYAAVLSAELAETPHAADLAEIEKAADRAANLTRQLLAFGRRQTLQPQLLSVAECVRDLDGLLRPAVPERIELVLDLDEQAAWVLADPSQIEQILLNLVVNARDATSGQGRIVVRVRSLELPRGDHTTTPPLAPGEYTTLVVEDSGAGIPDEALPHIFEPFFTTKAEGVGTGLGLPTVWGAVTQAGGALGVRTVGGEGTTMTVYLPAQRGHARSPEERVSRPKARAGNERVLVVEDEPAVRELVARVLEDNGYEVTRAALAREGIDALAMGEPFDLVVSDVVMPAMSGYELAAVVREEYPGTRLLFMSGYAHDAAQGAAPLDEDVTLLRKPFAPDELAAAVRHALDAKVVT